MLVELWLIVGELWCIVVWIVILEFMVKVDYDIKCIKLSKMECFMFCVCLNIYDWSGKGDEECYVVVFVIWGIKCKVM